MHLHLIAEPHQLAQAKQCTSQLVHAAYFVDTNGRLTSTELPDHLRGGLLLLTDRGTTPMPHPELLAQDVINECLQRRYAGVMLSCSDGIDDSRITFLQHLENALQRWQRQLYVPEPYAHHTSHATVLIGTALSGGSLQEHLSHAAEEFGGARLALDLQRLMMDFVLPSPSGEGKDITLQQLTARQAGRSVFFSPELCARYFTYRNKNGTHFVLFDDAETIRQKCAIGAALGITEGFLLWREVEDIANAIFAEKKSHLD